MSKSAERLNAAFLKAYRASALTSQGGCCKYCFEPLARQVATADHRVARKHGGTDKRGNIAAACQPCNRAKGHMSEAAFSSAIKGTDSAPFGILLIRARRRIWLATHASCKRIMASVGGDYQGPIRKAA